MAGRSQDNRRGPRRRSVADRPPRRQGPVQDPPDSDDAAESRLRIIGGRLRGKRLLRPQRSGTRPMKERVREAVFNLLGPAVGGAIAVDLFAGAGALGLEAISRGAVRAIFIEQHFPTANLIRDNARELGVLDQVEIHAGDAFYWWTRLETPPAATIVYFCSPPYQLYEDRRQDLIEMLATLADQSASGSVLMVEYDERFSPELLPQADLWTTRHYPPATVSRRVID